MTEFENDINNAMSILNDRGVILYPTDTIWGLGCDALNRESIEKIYNIKVRPKEKSMIVLLAEAKDILQYVATPHPDIIDIISNFAHPTTVIYNGALGFPDNLISDDGTIAIRVTNDPFCKTLIKRLGKPLVSTSANLSGDPSPTSYYAINEKIKQSVDYIVKHRQADNEKATASKIVTINEDGSLNIIRG